MTMVRWERKRKRGGGGWGDEELFIRIFSLNFIFLGGKKRWEGEGWRVYGGEYEKPRKVRMKFRDMVTVL